jgi:hypothetical protein
MLKHTSSKGQKEKTVKSRFLLRIASAIILSNLLLVLPLLAELKEDSIKLSFSADPTVAVLYVTYRGGLTGTNSKFLLYGDGRLEYRREGKSGILHEGYEFFLDYSEVEEILMLAAEHNLAEVSNEEIENKIKLRSADGRIPKITDAADMFLRISLTSYVREGEDYGAVRNEIWAHSPTYMLRFYPDIEELQGLADIAKKMKAFQRLARKQLQKRHN